VANQPDDDATKKGDDDEATKKGDDDDATKKGDDDDKKKGDGDATKKANGDDEKGGQSKQQKQQKKQQPKKPKKSPQEAGNPLEIQAVCSTEIESRIWLAVSREDKTLSLYSIPSTQQGQEKVEKSVYPTVTYNLPKRARCLAFSSVSPSSSTGNCHVIIAGDLSGDANAFPVPTTSEADAKPTATTRRLLLGHTCSMLTGLSVVPTNWDKKQQLILTADRDEKVRVTYFPETHITHGYLLGHSSFISAMDAAVAAPTSSSEEGSQRALCITGSGDGTVRLWDYQLCKEVGMVPVVIKKCDDDEKMGDEEMLEEKEEAVEEDEQEDEAGDEENFDDFTDDEQSFDGHAVAVPISVALSPNARHVIVARDGITSIDIHPIPPPPSKSSSASSTSLLMSHLVSLHKKQTLESPSQPLAVKCLSDGSVLVLAREPDYLLHFQCSEDSTEFSNISSTSPFSMALQGAVKDQTISMPATTLERDGEGEWKLQKNKCNDQDDPAMDGPKGKGGLHWNDGGRKETAKLAEQRRRKRRRDEAKKETVGKSES